MEEHLRRKIIHTYGGETASLEKEFKRAIEKLEADYREDLRYEMENLGKEEEGVWRKDEL